MKSVFAGLMGLLLILSGCTAGYEPPPVDGTDWCFLFRFSEDNQGFAVTAGANVGTSSGPIDATAAGTAFGLSTSFTATMPAEIDTIPLVFQPTEEGMGGSDVNISVESSQEIIIQSIDVRGMGGSPFPYNDCSVNTPTSQPGAPTTTATATGTATVTATGTPPTNTPGPTSTPDDGLQCVFDFSIDEQGWIGLYGGSGLYAGYDAGVGWFRGSANTRIAISKNITTTITAISIEFNHSFTGQLQILDSTGSTGFSTTYDRAGTTWTVSGLSLTDGIGINVFDENAANTAPADLRVVGITVTADDCESIETPTPTVTPTAAPTSTPGGPTNTPGPTATHEPLWTHCLDFTVSDFDFESEDATYEDELGWLQEAGVWSISRTDMDTAGKKKFKFFFSDYWSGSVRLTDIDGTPATSWKLGYGSEAIIDFSAESWTPTEAMVIEFDGSYGPFFLEKVCWVDLTPATATMGPGTGTPLYTRTPLATVTGRPNPSRTPILVPVPIIYITSTAGYAITTTPIYGGTGVYSPSGTPSTAITGTPGTEGTPAGDGGTGFGSGGGGFGDAGDMLGFAWQIGTGLFGAIIAYMGQATNLVVGLLTAFGNATPQAIPGLPLCVTNPMGSDLCAIYYIMDWTIFAPNTPGALIIPLLQIIMNIYIAIYFVRWVLRIVRRGEKVTDAP